MALTALLAVAASVNCLSSMYQNNLNRKTQAKRANQLIKTRKQHDLWVMEQQDKRLYRKLDPLVDYEIEPNTTFVAVADYLPEKSIGSHIRISIEEMLRERTIAGFPVKVLGGGGCIRGDIRGEGMVKQLFFELCEKLNDDSDSDLLGSVKLVVCWGAVQPLMGKITPHISMFNVLDHSGELRTGSLNSMLMNNGPEESIQSLDLRLSESMREQLWQSVNFTVDTVSMLTCLQRAFELKNPFMDDVLSQLDDTSKEQFKKLFLGFLDKYKQYEKDKSALQRIKEYERLLKANFEGDLKYSLFAQKTDAVILTKEKEKVEEDQYIRNGRLVLPIAIELMKRHFNHKEVVNTFVTDDIPRDKKAGAKSKYASTLNTKDILLLDDVTVFGSAKSGWLLTEDAIYSSAIASTYAKHTMKYADIDLARVYYDNERVAFRSKKKKWLVTPYYSAATVVIFAEFFEELLSTKVKNMAKGKIATMITR